MSAFLSLRGKLASGGTTVLGLALVDCCLSFYAHRRLLGRIDKAITSGTCLHLLSHQDNAHVDRKDLKIILQELQIDTKLRGKEFHIPVWCGSSIYTLAGAPRLHHTSTVISHFW